MADPAESPAPEEVVARATAQAPAWPDPVEQAPRVGLLSNPLSRTNATGGLTRVERLLRDQPQVTHCLARDPGQIERCLQKFAARGTDTLFINGGDGTVQAVLSTLQRHSPFSSAPRIALLPGGRTNVSAFDIGGRGSLARHLARLLRWSRGELTGELLPRRLLHVVVAPRQEHHYGLLFAAGGLAEGIEACRTFRDAQPFGPLRGTLGSLVWITGLLARLAMRRNPLPAIPLTMTMLCQGDESELQLASNLLLATTLQKLPPGISPFWGTAGGTIRYSAIRRPAHKLLRSLPRLLRGNANPPPRDEDGYHSGSWDSAALRFTGPFMIDGETLHLHPGQWLHIRATEPVTFLRVNP